MAAESTLREERIARLANGMGYRIDKGGEWYTVVNKLDDGSPSLFKDVPLDQVEAFFDTALAY